VALAARDAASAAAARLRIVAAMLGVQFGAPDVDNAAQTLSMRVDNVRAEAGAYIRPLFYSTSADFDTETTGCIQPKVLTSRRDVAE